MSSDLAPIALFVYNREEHTRATIEALTTNPQAESSDLYIFSDAAKSVSDKESVGNVRAYIQNVSGFNRVEIIERQFNFGLAQSIIDGVTHLCNKFGKIIVLEDDLITSPYFLKYMNDALERYKFDEQVMQVAGYMFPADIRDTDSSLFLPFPTSWGWATWERSWKHFDEKALGYERLKNTPTLIKKFNLEGHYNYFSMLEKYMSNDVDSWAIRWHLTVFTKQGLVLYPGETLVNNIGFDGSGVNCVASRIKQSKLSSNLNEIDFPENIRLSDKYDKVINAIPKQTLAISTILNHIKTKMKKIINF